MENGNNEITTALIGSFIFYNEKYMMANLSNSDLRRFQGFSKETILQSAMLDYELQNELVFYMLVEDYIYNILIPARDGHKLLISQANENEQMLNVYSLNYQEVISQEDNFKRRIR